MAGSAATLSSGPASSSLSAIARVMACRQSVARQAIGELEHRVEANVAVAADARVRRLARGVPGDERLDHAGAELVAQVDREVREAERVRERARLRDRRGRAAAALCVVLAVGPQLERDRDGLALRVRQKRGDRAVDAAAHRDERPRVASVRARRARARARTAAPSARASASAATSAACSLPGLSPPSSAAISRGSDPGRVEHRRPAHERDRGAPGGGRSAATLGLEAGVGYPVAVELDRRSGSVAARAAVDVHGEARSGRNRPWPCGEVRWCSNATRSTPPRIEAAPRVLDGERVVDALADLERVGEPDDRRRLRLPSIRTRVGAVSTGICWVMIA